MEACAQARRGVHKAVIIALVDHREQIPERLPVNGGNADAGGGGKQMEVALSRMGDSRVLQGAVTGQHVGEIHHRAIGHHHGNIQIPQAHVTVQAQGRAPQHGQGHSHVGGKGSLPRAALSRNNYDGLTHQSITSICYIAYRILPNCREGTRPLRHEFCCLPSFYSGVFFICANRRGYFFGVPAPFSTQTTLWTTSVVGIM